MEGYLGLMTNPQDREIATRKLNEQIGMETVAWFFLLSEAGFIAIFNGTPAQMASGQMIATSSGGFTKLFAEELSPSVVFLEGQVADARIKFDAPSHNEIDRLLIDE